MEVLGFIAVVILWVLAVIVLNLFIALMIVLFKGRK